jgi:DNA polymerase-4
MERAIIHLNIANFSVAVERRADSSLKSRPLIIAPRISRAMVYDMSEEAYREGVRKNMPLIQARKRCRSAIILPPTPERYEKAIQECICRVLPFTPQVERAAGSGHLYLDVTGSCRLFGPPPDIGWRIRKIFLRDLGLNPIWSVGSNKLVTKVASRIVKPAGQYVVTAGKERDFLAPLPLFLLPPVDKKIFLRLQELGIRSIAQASSLSLQDLHLFCGQRSQLLYHNLRGIDHTPVCSPATTEKRFFFRHHCRPDSNREEIIRPAVRKLARQAGYILRKQHSGCRRITVSLVYSDGVCIGRRVSSGKMLISHDQELEQMATTALFRCWKRRVLVRTIELHCSLVAHPVHQLSLFDHVNRKQHKQNELSKAIDILHERFGMDVLTKGGVH